MNVYLKWGKSQHPFMESTLILQAHESPSPEKDGEIWYFMNVAWPWHSIQKRDCCSFLKMSSYCSSVSQPQNWSTYCSSHHEFRGQARLALSYCPVSTFLAGQGLREGSRWQVEPVPITLITPGWVVIHVTGVTQWTVRDLSPRDLPPHREQGQIRLLTSGGFF